MIRLERRPQPSQVWIWATPLLAVALTMVAGGLMFAALGKDPFEAIRTIFWDPLFSEQFAAFSRPQLLVKAGPLILIAIGLSLGFRAGVWNIGAEGQYIVGAITGAAVALALYPLESVFIFPAMVLAGALGGFLWAMIPGILRTRFNTNEILVSLLLVYVAEQLLAAMALGALRNPEGGGFPGSRNLQQYASAANLELVAGTGMHWGVLTAFVAVIFAYVLLSRHVLGFHIRVTGASPRAARFAGVIPARLILICLGISGGLAGMAGLFEVAGPAGQISIDFNSGYGFTAIIVAFLGRLHPVGILLAGLLMALTYIGGELAQFMLGLPAASIQLFQGMLLFFLLGVDVLANYRVRFGKTGPGMMQRLTVFPVAMGAAMGVMMPFMVHGMGAQGAVWFVLAHVAALALALLILGTGLARLWPRMAVRLRAHRPGWRHGALMLAGATLGFAGLHVAAELGGLH